MVNPAWIIMISAVAGYSGKKPPYKPTEAQYSHPYSASARSNSPISESVFDSVCECDCSPGSPETEADKAPFRYTINGTVNLTRSSPVVIKNNYDDTVMRWGSIPICAAGKTANYGPNCSSDTSTASGSKRNRQFWRSQVTIKVTGSGSDEKLCHTLQRATHDAMGLHTIDTEKVIQNCTLADSGHDLPDSNNLVLDIDTPSYDLCDRPLWGGLTRFCPLGKDGNGKCKEDEG